MNPNQQGTSPMNFEAFELSLQLICALRAPLARLQQHDASLANQLCRAASSVSLNLSEGRRRVGKDRLHLWRIAAGSADEVRAALRVAQAWGYIEQELVAESLALLDRVLAMLWRMTHASR
jgi:four helix bundle protein